MIENKRMEVAEEWKRLFQQGHLEIPIWVLLLFGLFLFLLACLAYGFFRKFKQTYLREIERLCEMHQEGAHRAKQIHLEELEKAQERLSEAKRWFEEQVEKLKKKGIEAQSRDAMTIYELKNQVGCLKKAHIQEMGFFKDEMKRLKIDKKKIEDECIKELERANMQICDLKRQMRVLMDRM